ncbi:sugar ABC transporter substrate-binding protein [Neobacillus sp. FSL H8-0543]|uniref:ABC transporter substrate-binding protein n=1 Tax=Neobacillus sp. FSL H8-0543 TaxID=2954672 RepID=UPI0031582DEB
MKKKLIALILVLVLIVTACAPGTSQNQSTSGSGSGDSKEDVKEINVIARSGTYYNNLSKVAPEFEKETGIKVNLQEVGRDGYLQKVSTQLLGQGDSTDVILMLNNYIGQFGEGGQFEPLDSYMKENNFNLDHVIPAVAESVTYKEQVFAMPLDTSTHFLFYRKDLIPNPPETWEEYREVAKKFTQSQNPDSPTEFGTTFQGKRGETQPKEWYQYFWAMGGEILDKDNKPTLNSDSGVEALTYVVDNFRKEKIVPPDATTYEFPEVLSAFQNEKVAMAVEWNTAYPQLADANTSPKVSDKFAIADVPGGKPFIHTWTLAINSNSKMKDAAYKFISWVSSPAGAKKYALAGGFPPIPEVLEDPEVIKLRPEFPDLQRTLMKAKAEPSLPEWPRLHEFITDAISKALAGEKSPKEALDEANDSIYDLLESRGYYK